jgi:hypothetical protein
VQKNTAEFHATARWLFATALALQMHSLAIVKRGPTSVPRPTFSLREDGDV